MAQALHLDIPTPSKLTEALESLCEAAILVSDVKSLLVDSGDFAMAARLKDIQGRLADEVQAIERLIEQAGSSLLKRRDCALTCMAVTRRGRSALSFTSPQLQSATQGGIYGQHPIRNPAGRA